MRTGLLQAFDLDDDGPCPVRCEPHRAGRASAGSTRPDRPRLGSRSPSSLPPRSPTIPGVRTHADGGWRGTRDGARGIPGVSVATGAEGLIDVDLQLLAYMPHRLFEGQAESIREARPEAARQTGTAERFGQIEVATDDMIAPSKFTSFTRPDRGSIGGGAP